MHLAVCSLKSASPYSQSRPITVPKLDKEGFADYETRTWRERAHAMEDGHVFIPAPSFKNCIAEAAKYLGVQIPGKGKSTYTKHFEAGVMVTPDPLVLPITKDEMKSENHFVPASGRRGDAKRVWKTFPFIPEWSGTVTFMVVDDTITKDVFRYHIEQAGSFIGIGRFRPRNNGFYGRFTVTGMEWQKVG